MLEELKNLAVQISSVYITLAAILPSLKTDYEIIPKDKVKEIKNIIKKLKFSDEKEAKMTDDHVNNFTEKYEEYSKKLKNKQKLPIFNIIITAVLWILISIIPTNKDNIYVLLAMLIAVLFLGYVLTYLISNFYLLIKYHDELKDYPTQAVVNKLEEEIKIVKSNQSN